MKKTLAPLILLLLLVFTSPLTAQELVDYIISWQPNPEPDVNKYIIYRSLDPDVDFVAIDSVDASVTTYTDTNLEKGVRYYYRLVAKDVANVASPFSSPVSGMTIAQDAAESIKDLCRISSAEKIGTGTYDVLWSTVESSTGFVQYDTDLILDSSSEWDEILETDHTARLNSLEEPESYFLRAVSYDTNNNMTVSAMDTLETIYSGTVAPSAPIVKIYPMPYHPSAGNLVLENLPSGGSITIYNEGGLEVYHEAIGTASMLEWEGVNNQGTSVMSGIYYVLIKDSANAVRDKKAIMIIN